MKAERNIHERAEHIKDILREIHPWGAAPAAFGDSKKGWNVSLKRALAYALRYEGFTFPEIGREMGVDHSNAVYHVEMVKVMLASDAPADIVECRTIHKLIAQLRAEAEEREKDVTFTMQQIREVLLNAEDRGDISEKVCARLFFAFGI